MTINGIGTIMWPMRSKSLGLHFISEKDVYFFKILLKIYMHPSIFSITKSNFFFDMCCYKFFFSLANENLNSILLS